MLRTFIFILLSCALSIAVANEQRTQAQQEIAKAAQDVAELKKLLNKIEQEKSSAQQALKKTETEIGELEKQVNDLQQQEKKN